jgi:hypothetical protein
MAERLSELVQRRTRLLEELAQLDNFRSGSITVLVRPCGKPGCRCSQPGDPGHGPNLRLTYKQDGKTRSESLPDRRAVQKARKEIAEFRRFQQLIREFTAVNTKICQLLP